MATKKNSGGEGVEDVTDAPAVDTREAIAMDLLNSVEATGGRESPLHDIVLRALQRVKALAV